MDATTWLLRLKNSLQSLGKLFEGYFSCVSSGFFENVGVKRGEEKRYSGNVSGTEGLIPLTSDFPTKKRF